MIKNYACKETEKIFNGKFSKKLPHNIQERAFKKLHLINAAQNVEDLRIPPSNRLETLIGSRKGQYSVRINDQYRICFDWADNNACNVEITDYHD